MAFIKYSDGKIAGVVKERDLTDDQKDAVKKVANEIADKSNDSDLAKKKLES